MAFGKIALGYRFAKQGLRLMRLGPDSRLTTPDLIEKWARLRPDHAFCLFEDRRVTYAEYNAAANRIAHWATQKGLKRGDVVALFMLNRPEYLETWAGLAKVGITTALINTNLTGRSLRHALEAAKARQLIVGVELLESYATLGAEDPLSMEVFVSCPKGDVERADQFPEGALDLERAVSGSPTANPDASARAELRAGDDLFYIYTSGTTGLPKAARFSHYKFMTTGGLAPLGGFGRSDTMYVTLPLYHSAGGAMAVSAVLQCGATIALRQKFSARGFWDDIRKYEATSFQYIGEFCRYLLNVEPSPKDGEHKLRFALGNGLRPDIWAEFVERFKIPHILEFYGATEGNVALMNLSGKVGSIGRMPPKFLADARLIQYDVENDEYPRDANGFCIECEPEQVGELIGAIKVEKKDSGAVFEGYTSKEATEKKILRDVFRKGDAWFSTGDLLRGDAEGDYYFVDRIGDTFRWKGENVSTQDVAEALGAYEGVEMVNVYGVEIREQDVRAGMASLMLADSANLDGAKLYQYVADSLPVYAAPVFVRIQIDAEVTGTFKLRKVELQKEGCDPRTISDPIYVRDDSKRAYVPLDGPLYEAVQSGSLRV